MPDPLPGWTPADAEAGLKAILNGLPAMIGYWDRDLRNRLANQAYVEYFGFTPAQMRGLHIRDVLGPELYEQNRPYMERALAGEAQLFDREIPTPSGELRYTQASYIPDVADGEVQGFFVLVTDITPRHRAEVGLHASEERYRALVEHLPNMAITLVGPDLRLRWLDGGVVRETGLDVDALVGRPVRDTSGGGEHGALIESLYARALAGETVSAEIRSRVTGLDMSVEIVPLRGSDDRVTAALGVAQDITARKQAERVIAEEHRLLIEAQSLAQIGSWEYGLQEPGGVRTWSPQMWRIIGGEPRPAGPEMAEFLARIHPEDRERVDARFQAGIAARAPVRDEFRIQRPDGTIAHVESRSEVICDAEGAAIAVRGTLQDVTRQRELVEELRATNSELLLQSQITAQMAEGALLIRERDLRLVHVNARAEAMFGYEPGALTGAHLSTLNADDGRTPAEVATWIAAQVAAGGGAWSGDILSARRDGSTFWRHASISRFEHPEHGGLLVSVLGDITPQRDREAEEKALGAIATLVAEGVGPAAVFAAVADEIRGLFDGRVAAVVRFDAAAGRGTVVGGQSSSGDTIVGQTVDLGGSSASAEVFRTGRPARLDARPEPGSASADDPAFRAWARLGLQGGVAAPVVVGGALWGVVTAGFRGRPVPEAAELRLARFAPLVALAIANAEAWETLSRQAATDPVTGIANHRTFHERLRAETERARRYGRDLSLVLLDLDHFKQVNDTYGHHVGDEVLREVAQRIAAQAREGELVARVGGEEFGWLMPETTQDGAFAAAERVRRAISGEPFAGAGTLTISAGVCSTAHGEDAEALARYADRALYWAKDGGRNTTFVYTDAAREALAGEGRRAERTQALTGVRALARAIDAKDWSTHRHSERVAFLAERLALELGWTADRTRLLHEAALLHDVGKIGVPDAILLKPGPLTPAEREVVERHVALSASIAGEVLQAEQVAWIQAHHEHWDGGGYPGRLAGEAIPDGAQVLAVAEAWDDMVEARVYTAARAPEDALGECVAGRGRQFSPAVVDALQALVARGALAAPEPR